METIPVAEEATPAEAPSDATALDDIVVTATKREKSVREVPISIDAFSGEKLVQKGATQLEDIVRDATGLTKNGSRVVIRAVATTAVASFVTSEETGRFFGDTSLNAPSIRGGLPDFDPYDMSTVEVLKGPQASLFGGTALAGAIRYVPTEPDLYGFAGSARVGTGTQAHTGDPQKEVSFMLNGGFFDSVGLRLVGTQRARPGVTDDLSTGEPDVDRTDMDQVRALGRWQPFDNARVDLAFLDWKSDGEWAFTDRPDRYETRAKTIQEPITLKTRLLSARAEYDFDAFSVIGVASRLENSMYWILDLAPLLGSSQPVAGTADIIDTNATVPTYELRLVSSRPSESSWAILRDWEYLAGVFWMRAEQYANQLVAGSVTTPIPGFTVEDGTDGRAYSDAQEEAFFFDTTRTLFDKRFEINLGGRLAKTHLDTLSFTNANGQQATPAANTVDDKRFNPKLALTWNFSRDLSIRTSASQGFRFGGANANATAAAEGIPRTFDSDSLWNYELGLRSDWLDRMLRFDTTGFYIDWTDLQITQVTAQTSQNFVTNVGAARILGVESRLLWRLPGDWPILPEGLTVSLGGSYIDARITVPFNSSKGPVPAGTRLPLTPYLLANAALTWDGGWGPWLLTASVSDAYSGPRESELIKSTPLQEYTVLGAMFRVVNPNWRFAPAISLIGTNLLDRNIAHFGYTATTDASKHAYVLNRPRTVLVNLEASF